MKDDDPKTDADMDLVEALFCKALEMDTDEEREAFLKKECGGNDDLRQVVERLLSRHNETENFFQESLPTRISAVEISNTLADIPDFFEKMEAIHADDDEIGKQIGPYKLLQKIGEGGAGNVYLAEQTKPVRRQVALKIIKLGMDTKSVIARFEAERQTLAMMEHPNIAHVLGAGETEAGRPYFVMELVHGVKVTTYCDEAVLDVRQRLELFNQVCRAIQHAHQKGVIHRDIKPSNVLITSHDGVAMPMVIDFGIAKATGENQLSDQTFFTALEPFMGTPAYMSPEQARMSKGDVDTRSDIYSLGVLLYELLAGRTPFDQKELMSHGVDEMRRILCERDPLRPSIGLQRLEPQELETVAQSRASGPQRLVAALSGDLDCIVMKALEKDRSRRYETVDAFAMDIERFLNDEPVVARPPSRRYRFRKLVRRNRSVFAAVGAIAAVLVIGLALSSWLFVKERVAKQRAENAERVAEEARANEAKLRRQAETRQNIAQAAFMLSRNHPEEADRLMTGIQLGGPSIEGAAVLRQLGEWHGLRGEWPQALVYYRQLLNVNQLDNLDIASLDFLACEAALLQLGAGERIDALRNEIVARGGGNWPVQSVARMLMGALLLPVDSTALDELKPMADFVDAQLKAGSGTQREDAPSDGLWERLKLVSCGTDTTPRLIQGTDRTTFVAGGENIWENRDSFALAYTTVLGDFDFRLHVHSVTREDSFSRAGLMARVSVDDPGSRHIMVAVNAQDTFQVLRRSKEAGVTTSYPPNPLPEAWGSNSWVRLQRVGTIFRSYSSANGRDWVLLDSYQSATEEEGPFVDPIYVGIASCAHSPTESIKAVLSDFSPTPPTSIEAMLAMALLHYRSGDFQACADLCNRCWSQPELNAPRAALARVLLALASQKLGETAEARIQQAKAREMIDNVFARQLNAGGGTQGHWFEWVIARALLREAEVVAPQ